MYGGYYRDWMQSDLSAPGRVSGDRMIDWAGAFNAYYRCDAAYGSWVITCQYSPSWVAFLQNLAQGFGAFDTSTPGSSGFRETAIVFPTEIKFNSNPPNPDNFVSLYYSGRARNCQHAGKVSRPVLATLALPIA